MHIQFERTGGFAGMRMTATMDTQTMPAEEAKKLLTMVEAANFFRLPSTIRPSSPGADSFQYKVNIEHQGQEHTVETGEIGISTDLRALLRYLTVLSRPPR